MQLKRDSRLYQRLKKVIDPELRVSIVDLGLIYGVEKKGSKAHVTMTLTTPYCPMAPEMQNDVKNTLLKDDSISEVVIDLVWEPIWDPSTMASDEIKDLLGLW